MNVFVVFDSPGIDLTLANAFNVRPFALPQSSSLYGGRRAHTASIRSHVHPSQK